MEITLTEQRAQKRMIVHAVQFIPEHRGVSLDLVEDVFPVVNTRIQVRTKAEPASAYLAPQREPLSMKYQEPYVTFVVPEVNGHQMIVLQF